MNAEIPAQATDTHASAIERLAAAAPGAPWIGHVMRARNATPTGIVALARILDVDTTPPALRALARAYVEERLYRADRPRARTSDPETSQAAAEAVRGPIRPGGVAHKVLSAYAEHRAGPNGVYEQGLTSREIEARYRIRAAHKRTSEFLQDGLLKVVTRGEKAAGEAHALGSGAITDPFDDPAEAARDATRGGGRILRITDDGMRELRRLDAAKRVRDDEARAKGVRRAARDARRRTREE